MDIPRQKKGRLKFKTYKTYKTYKPYKTKLYYAVYESIK